MNTFVLVVAGFGVALVGYSLFRYLGSAHNNLVESRERCQKTWSDVEVLLERRAEELGNLADLTKQHVSHEKDVLEDVLEARERAIEAQSPEEAQEALVVLRESAQELYDLSSEYPELDSSDRFDDLARSIERLEQRLENRREEYNEAVAAYNSRLNQVPERFIADYRNYRRREPFVASAEAHEGVDLDDRLDLASQ
ncbi:LemA family protein [Haloarchaeobius amylolyticus]|uniref:LemA family protein n=1 Tax=Haloarchaeobius amylolyticus TaxID=1198296 RepID=UPI00226E5EF1|nr:LemA family protein [Haloarchaeobius amylolyticus]